MANPHTAFLTVSFIFTVITSGPKPSGSTKSFTIVNYCNETIWPGITHSDNFSSSGFTLKPGQSAEYTASDGWNGRIWARTGCNFDKKGNGKCKTGDSGSSSINCTGPGSPPATIAEFTLGALDYYDISLVDGFNLPIAVQAFNGTGNCSSAGCDGDLRQSCPSQLAVKDGDQVIACQSACSFFNTDEYCCRGIHADPITCLPSNYSKSFKQICPTAYSFAFDDPTRIITCTGANFAVIFCASRNQTVCSYHDNQLVCNGVLNESTAHTAKPHSWLAWMLSLAFMFNLWVTS